MRTFLEPSDFDVPPPIEFDNVPHVDLIVPAGLDSFEIEILQVRTFANNATGYGAVLTALLGEDPERDVDRYLSYTNGAAYEWTPPPGLDPDGNQIMYGDGISEPSGGIGGGVTPYGVKPVGSVKFSDKGCRLNGDNLENPAKATRGIARFECPGSVVGQAVEPSYRADMTQDENNWSFNSAHFLYSGFWHRAGARIRKIRFCANASSAAPNATISGSLQPLVPAMKWAT